MVYKMSAKELKSVPMNTYDPLPVCVDHSRRTCHQCLHNFNCDPNGQYDAKLHYSMQDRAVDLSPLRGLEALFIPQLDAHLGLSTGVGQRSDTSNGLYVEEIANEDLTIKFVKPPAMAPSDDWFHFCKECSLTWLSGYEGPLAAAKHPSHTALHDKRTLIAWVGTKEVKTSGQMENIGVVSFGQASKYNHTVDATSADEAILSAVLLCLNIVSAKIIRNRQDLVERYVHTNSDAFLQKAKLFRLVVLISEPSVEEFFTGLGCSFFQRSVYGIYRTRGDTEVPAIQRFNHDILQHLELKLEELARINIMVKWYLVHPKLNMAMLSSE